MRPRRFWIALPLCTFASLTLLLRAEEPAKPAADDFKATPEQEAFFEKTIRPLLVAKCLECHGEKQQKGDLRLDSRGAVLKGNDGGPAVVPGKPGESRLIEVIGYKDPVQMPPKGKLADAEIAALTEWIKMGAPFPGGSAATASAAPLGSNATPEGIAKFRASHWSLQPVKKIEPPSTKVQGWNSSAIDRFIAAKLEGNGLTPSAPVDKRTLLRRVTFDLIGLPPTMEEVAAFESDTSPDSFAKVVDRLLASPHYGERWGRHWLDVARYADTKGYVFTEERKYPYSYTYRDYVIAAFNKDLPFDRFILEQIAADQLDLGNDKAALAAMGFLTVGRRFSNNINDIIDDRIDVVSRGFLGMTAACARCHDHKYDPIPTADYYSLYGVFNSSNEPKDLPLLATPQESENYRAFEKELAAREGTVNAYVDKQHTELTAELRAKAGDYLMEVVNRKPEPVRRRGGQSIGKGEPRPQVIERWREYVQQAGKQHHPVLSAWNELAKLPADGFAEAAAKVIEGLNDAADAPQRVNSLVKKTLVEAAPKSMGDVAKAYGELLVRVEKEWQTLRTEAEKTAGGNADKLPKALPDAAAEEVRQVLYAEGSPTVLSRDDARRAFDRKARDEVKNLERKVEEFKANSPNAPPRAMVMNDNANPANVRVFIRGNNGRLGNEAPRRFFQVLSAPEAKFTRGSGRLELAQAIANPSNPLTARVIVNRVWQHHFGFGLVRTPSDFGLRGESPTHPELLDWLAATFVEEGWSLKKLHRRMLLTAAYQQQSLPQKEGTAKDPENRLLWRMNPQRLEFEPMRDSLLTVAGRLDRTQGGRAVDLFAQPFPARRAVYGFIDRQDLPGTFRAFDFASPDVSTPMRPQTTIPQQALYGMNSPFVVEQAKHLAARPEVAAASDPVAKVQALYRLVYARAAEAYEVEAGVRFLAEPSVADAALAGGWQYGYGEIDEGTKQTKSFTPLPHFQDGQWRGGRQLPDAKVGWVLLTAAGGHPGGTPQLAVIRRWVAPSDGIVNIAATLEHPAEQGDGVRARIVSSRTGELGSWTAHHGKADTKIDRAEVKAGEILDFVVDCRTNENSDSFQWPPVIVLSSPGPAGKDVRKQFVAPAEFRGPQGAGMSPLEQYAQALLLANEFVFVD